MLYLVGIGLGGIDSISVKAYHSVKNCDRVYLESYTSLCPDSLDKMIEFLSKDIILADRLMTENNTDFILTESEQMDVAFLVIGDPLGFDCIDSATTHTDLMIRSKQKGIKVKVYHNSSILTAIGVTGLQLYKFGETVSIVRWTDTWKPTSFFDKIVANYERDLHTLCLLDIKLHEPSIEGLINSVEASGILLEIIRDRASESNAQKHLTLSEDIPCLHLSRIAWEEQKIIFTTLDKLSQSELNVTGGFPHCLIIPAKNTHPLELEFMQAFEFDRIKL